MNKLVTIIVSLLSLIIIFVFTNPTKNSLVLLLVPFILIGFIVYMTVNMVIQSRIFKNVNKGSLKVLIPISMSFLVVTLLLLASLGQLTIRDGLLVISFTTLFLLYIVRADFLQ